MQFTTTQIWIKVTSLLHTHFCFWKFEVAAQTFDNNLWMKESLFWSLEFCYDLNCSHGADRSRLQRRPQWILQLDLHRWDVHLGFHSLALLRALDLVWLCHHSACPCSLWLLVVRYNLHLISKIEQPESQNFNTQKVPEGIPKVVNNNQETGRDCWDHEAHSCQEWETSAR